MANDIKTKFSDDLKITEVCFPVSEMTLCCNEVLSTGYVCYLNNNLTIFKEFFFTEQLEIDI